MNRKISDRYSERLGWSNLPYGPMMNITLRADVMSTSRLFHGMMGMRGGIKESMKPISDWPCLLHSDPEYWPYDRNDRVIKFRFC